jgi:hypothetical protein
MRAEEKNGQFDLQSTGRLLDHVGRAGSSWGRGLCRDWRGNEAKERIPDVQPMKYTNYEAHCTEPIALPIIRRYRAADLLT